MKRTGHLIQGNIYSSEDPISNLEADAAQAAIKITDRAVREEVSADIRASIAASKARYSPRHTIRPVRLEFNGVKNAIELSITYVFYPERERYFITDVGGAYVEIRDAYCDGYILTDLLGKPLLDALAADILRECK